MTGSFFHSVGNVIIPIDELIFFRGFETTNQMGITSIVMISITITKVRKHITTIIVSILTIISIPITKGNSILN